VKREGWRGVSVPHEEPKSNLYEMAGKKGKSGKKKQDKC
jgi:hypothetical protein